MSTVTAVFESTMQVCIALLFLFEKLNAQQLGEGGANGGVSEQGQAIVLASAAISIISVGNGLLRFDRLLCEDADELLAVRPRAFRTAHGDPTRRKLWHTLVTLWHRLVELQMVGGIFVIGLGISAKTGASSTFATLSIVFVSVCYFGLVAMLLVKRCTSRAATQQRGFILMCETPHLCPPETTLLERSAAFATL
jgi:hypothetical protein